MSTVLVHIHVLPGFRDAFIEATRLNCRNSRLEAGNLRFDLLQMPEEPDRFLLYESYASEAAARAHKETEHYRTWRDTVAPMMAEPRTGVPWVRLDA